MISVRADGLGKAYRVYKRPIDSLKEALLGREYGEMFWALRDVSLDVGSGGSLGIIGDNGAGKSTLLKLLAGAIAATTGRVERTGRVAAMLNLGAGFHPDLTGLENIRIGCALLGLSPGETETALPAIVEFSELGDFIGRPVRTYSSGMYLRLGFSVATAVNPDVLVVDEHLSVGDQHFRFKCMRRIMALREGGTALVLCSHDLHVVGEVCDRVMWLRDGAPVMLARPEQTLKAYQDHIRARDAQPGGTVRQESAPPVERRHPADNYLDALELGGDVHDGHIETGGRLQLRVVATLSPAIRPETVHVGVLLVRNDAVWCYGVSTQMDGLAGPLSPLGDGRHAITYTIDDLPLLSGQYTFTVALMDGDTPHVYDSWTGAVPFQVRHQGKDVGVVRLAHRWEVA